MSENNLKKQKILIVDDSEFNRSILSDMLSDDYEIFEASDGVEAIALIQSHIMELSAVLLDIVMPRMNGFEVLAAMNQRHWIDDLPVIIISAESGSGQIEQAYSLGATDFIMRPFDAVLVHRRVINTILLYTKQKKLMGLVVEQVDEKERRSNMMVDILSHIVEFRNGESGQHIIHIRTFTEVMLHQLQRMTDRYPLTQADISLICLASSLHDIGKIAIDEKILNKPGRLTKEEFEVMKTHSLVGSQMLENLPAYQDEPLVKTAWEICRWHHERYDGRGYPDGLKGDDIPISAQVVALADVYDALVSDRCYKKAFQHDVAIKMILNGECGTFNPILKECLEKVEGILDTEFSRIQIQEHRIARNDMIKELLHGEKLFASERSLHLLDQERLKYNFFSATTKEIHFEYTAEQSMLTISSWGANRLGLDEVIMNPSEDPRIKRMFEHGGYEALRSALFSASPDSPTVNIDCRFIVDGQSRWYQVTAMTIWSDDAEPKCTSIIGKAFDIHDSKIRMDELESKASRDPLTGLLNGSSAKERIQSMIYENPDSSYVMVLFDIDVFKSINDTYGHLTGDSILKLIAEKLKTTVRENDIIARTGGDEFLIFMSCSCGIESIIERIFNSVNGCYNGISLTVSMGIAQTPAAGRDYESLFYAADLALYSSKRVGKNHYSFYDESMNGTLLSASESSCDRDKR